MMFIFNGNGLKMDNSHKMLLRNVTQITNGYLLPMMRP